MIAARMGVAVDVPERALSCSPGQVDLMFSPNTKKLGIISRAVGVKSDGFPCSFAECTHKTGGKLAGKVTFLIAPLFEAAAHMITFFAVACSMARSTTGWWCDQPKDIVIMFTSHSGSQHLLSKIMIE